MNGPERESCQPGPSFPGKCGGSSEEIYGFHVERKGIDTWGFGIHSPEESTQSMDEIATELDLESIVYPEYKFQRFAR